MKNQHKGEKKMLDAKNAGRKAIIGKLCQERTLVNTSSGQQSKKGYILLVMKEMNYLKIQDIRSEKLPYVYLPRCLFNSILISAFRL
jgi:hypothetical protein